MKVSITTCCSSHGRTKLHEAACEAVLTVANAKHSSRKPGRVPEVPVSGQRLGLRKNPHQFDGSSTTPSTQTPEGGRCLVYPSQTWDDIVFVSL